LVIQTGDNVFSWGLSMKFDRANEQTTYSEKEIDHLACAYVIALGYEGAIMLFEGLLSGSEQSTVEPDDALAILCRRVLDAINDEAATITRILDRMLPALLAGQNHALADEFACRPNLIDRHIGGRVQQRRVQLGWSTAEFADRLHLSIEELGALEEGTTRIDGRLLDRAGECLGVPVGHFFQRDEAA
jgi:DNA-binding transcriptional regulator YiaG